MINALIALGVISVAVFILTTIMIYSFVSKHKTRMTSFLFINLFIFRYLEDYRQLTKKETGKVGYLFYTYVISINIALICFIVFLILK